MVGLFDQARLAALPEALVDYQKLGDPNVVARTLLAQINYTADVAANMPPHAYTTGSATPRACLCSASEKLAAPWPLPHWILSCKPGAAAAPNQPRPPCLLLGSTSRSSGHGAHAESH